MQTRSLKYFICHSTNNLDFFRRFANHLTLTRGRCLRVVDNFSKGNSWVIGNPRRKKFVSVKRWKLTENLTLSKSHQCPWQEAWHLSNCGMPPLIPLKWYSCLWGLYWSEETALFYLVVLVSLPFSNKRLLKTTCNIQKTCSDCTTKILNYNSLLSFTHNCNCTICSSKRSKYLEKQRLSIICNRTNVMSMSQQKYIFLSNNSCFLLSITNYPLKLRIGFLL